MIHKAGARTVDSDEFSQERAGCDADEVDDGRADAGADAGIHKDGAALWSDRWCGWRKEGMMR
jgi:hypothetical protein